MRKEKQRIKVVGICVARIQEDYEANMVLAIGRELKSRGIRCIVFNSFSDMFEMNEYVNGEASIYKLIHRDRVDALVVLSESIKNDTISNQIIDFAKECGIPAISIERKLENCVNVQFGYEEAFEEIVRHIVEYHQCTEVNFIAGMKENAFSNARLEIYRKVLAENGIAYDETRVGYGDFWSGPTRSVMEQFLSDDRGLPEAIICCNDTMALTVCQVLHERGYRIPEDIIVTGFDGIEIEKYSSPRLTTAATDFDMLGKRVCDVLEKLECGEPITETLKVDFKVRISQSCGCQDLNAYDAFDQITAICDKMIRSRGHEAFMYAYIYDSLACKTYNEIARTAARHAEELNVWVCLNRDFFRDMELSPKYNGIFANEMVLMFHTDDMELLAFCEEYNLIDYLPNLEQAFEENDILVFSPIHYQDKTYGYSVVGVSSEQYDFERAHRYLNNTNQILESVRKSVRLNIAYAELKEMNLRDSLTGLYNRRGFEKKCSDLLAGIVPGKEILIMSIDLDNLKYINDHYGHAMGDLAITTSANIFNNYSVSDSVCARFGGDEYVLVLATDSAADQEKKIMDYLDAKLKEFNHSEEHPFELVMSIGFAGIKEPTMEMLYETLKIADSKMYEQKRKHKMNAKSRQEE